jgi:hypothetical protein
MADIPSTPADGNVKIVAVPAIADTSAPTVTELTAGTAVDLSCYLTADGWQPSQDQATISDERLCSTQVFGAPGRKTLGLTVRVIDNTNSPNEATDNAAVDTLEEGTQLYFVERRGVPFDEPITADHKVRVWPVTVGMKQNDPPEANSVLKATYPMFVNSDVVDVTAVAGA